MTYVVDTIEVWRSTTGIDPVDFSLYDSFDDPGTGWTYTDPAVTPQQLYIYKFRRYDFGTGAYSEFSTLVYARGPWPQGVTMSGTTQATINTLLGYGQEVNEGEPVAAQILLRRKSGAFDADLQKVAHEALQATDVMEIEDLPGVGRLDSTPFLITPTPESVTYPLNAMYGWPTTTNGGGTAPATPTLATATTTGTIAHSTQIQVKAAYVRPTDWEQTTASTAASVTAGAGTETNTVTVTSPIAQTGATGYNVYARIGASGVFTKQNAAPIPIGTDYVFSAPPTTTGLPAPAAFYVHTYLGSLLHKPGTITEKRGTSIYAFPGVVVDSLESTVDKTQNTPLEFTWNLKALNHLAYAAIADVGLDVAGFDTLSAWSAPMISLSLNGAVSDEAKGYTQRHQKSMDPTDVLNNHMGAVDHYPTGSTNTISLNMYFKSDVQMERYFGVLDAQAKPYGPSKNIRTIALVIEIASQINSNGYRNKLIWTYPKVSYKKVGKPVPAGKGAIMQTVECTAQLDAALGASFKVDVWNGMSQSAVRATGTPLSSVPVNDMTSYTL